MSLHAITQTQHVDCKRKNREITGIFATMCPLEPSQPSGGSKTSRGTLRPSQAAALPVSEKTGIASASNAESCLPAIPAGWTAPQTSGFCPLKTQAGPVCRSIHHHWHVPRHRPPAMHSDDITQQDSPCRTLAGVQGPCPRPALTSITRHEGLSAGRLRRPAHRPLVPTSTPAKGEA